MRSNHILTTVAFIAAASLGLIAAAAAQYLGLKGTYCALALLVGSFHAYALLGVLFLFMAFFV